DADALHRVTDGNPFFVTEVVGAGTTEVPSTVRDAVLARTWRLSAPARALLEAITIAPPATDLDVLEAIAGGSLGSLEECIDGGMVVAAAPGVAFRHELGRLVIEESIPPDRRIALHARALAALERSGDSVRLAHHAEAAGDAEAVLRFAPEAAEQAAA